MNRSTDGQLTDLDLEGREDLRWLEPRWPELVEAFRTLGPVRVTTTNRTARIAKTGPFEDVNFDSGPVGAIVGEAIDLRLFTQMWRYARATPPETPPGERAGIQVIDDHGRTALSLELVDGSDRAAYESLLESFADEAPEELEAEPAPASPSMTVEDVDAETRESFQTAWEELEHTHAFHGILREHGLERRVALQIAPEGRARPFSPSILGPVIEGAEEREIPLMLFVSSGGCVQIHSGPTRLEHFDEATAVIRGTDLEMEADLAELPEAWVVEKPTEDGHVTSIELFDDGGELSFQVFGQRKPGKTERRDWRALVAECAEDAAPARDVE